MTHVIEGTIKDSIGGAMRRHQRRGNAATACPILSRWSQQGPRQSAHLPAPSGWHERRSANTPTRRELWTPSFRRAWVSRGDDGVKLEWCQDSAWRFFPIESDDLLGWRLHWFDAITNKALAMGSRAETRDLVDIVTYAARCPLHAVIWAACSKDPGFGPLLLLDLMRRNSRVNPAELREMGASLDPLALKRRWIDIARIAESAIEDAGAVGVDVGLAFVHSDGVVGWFDEAGAFPHRATLGGAAPRIVG
jgi:hypothetical protein